MNKKIENKSGANAVGHSNVVTAIATALYDQFSKQGLLDSLKDSERVDGKTCLITGANAGLGKATAIQMAKRGARVIMACRGGHPEAGEEVKRESGSDLVEMMKVDLSDMESVVALCNELHSKNIHLDIIILNAGLMPLNARKSQQGYELMFAVHFLANRLFLSRCVQDGVIDISKKATKKSRVIFVASEAHQSSQPIDFDNFGAFTEFGIKDGMKYYGLSKLHMTTLAKEFSRRVNQDEGQGIIVSSLCPGPIASSIAREAPSFLKPVLSPIMKLFFNSPEVAAKPVVLLACAKNGEQFNNAYLHMMREKQASPLAESEENGRLLWEKSETLLKEFLPSPMLH
jgi:NAD(P)-dependent dehydrogenase (short-subunit alcohol dehydrogenase family)